MTESGKPLCLCLDLRNYIGPKQRQMPQVVFACTQSSQPAAAASCRFIGATDEGSTVGRPTQNSLTASVSRPIGVRTAGKGNQAVQHALCGPALDGQGRSRCGADAERSLDNPSSGTSRR